MLERLERELMLLSRHQVMARRERDSPRLERSAYLHVPINLMYSVYIIFAVACIARYAWLVYRAIRGEKPPETEPAKLGD